MTGGHKNVVVCRTGNTK